MIDIDVCRRSSISHEETSVTKRTSLDLWGYPWLPMDRKDSIREGWRQNRLCLMSLICGIISPFSQTGKHCESLSSGTNTSLMFLGCSKIK